MKNIQAILFGALLFLLFTTILNLITHNITVVYMDLGAAVATFVYLVATLFIKP